MARSISLYALAGAAALLAAACTPAADDADTAADAGADTTTIIEREVPANPVVVEREVPVAVPTPPVVVERAPRDGDSTTVRAGENGIEVETTNR